MSHLTLTGLAVAMICSPIHIYSEKSEKPGKEMVKKEAKKKKKGCPCGK